jgi:hypothetical protein
MSLPPYDQSIRELERHYQVVLPDSVGQAALGFRDGVWFRLNSGTPRPVQIRSAIILCPHAAGSIVQIVCWWMRENVHTSRALDLATELALCVGELARKAVEDDPLGMSLDSLSTSQQNAMLGGYSAGIPQQAPAPSPYPSQPVGAGAGLGQTGYESGSYGAGWYQASTDPYAAPYGAPGAGAAATTVLPQIPSDGGYGMPQQAPRGPAIPPRAAGVPGGGPGGSGGYPQQRPAQPPISGQPMRPQQGGRYPQGQGRPPQPRPTPRPDRYEDDQYRGGQQQRPQSRGDQGGAW